MEALKTIGALVTLMGSIFIFLGGLGIVRMPDLFNRIQAGTKASTLGTILSMLGLAIMNEAWIWKLLVIIFFVLITNPVSSNVISRAAHFRGTKMTDKTVADLLAEKYNKPGEE